MPSPSLGVLFTYGMQVLLQLLQAGAWREALGIMEALVEMAYGGGGGDFSGGGSSSSVSAFASAFGLMPLPVAAAAAAAPSSVLQSLLQWVQAHYASEATELLVLGVLVTFFTRGGAWQEAADLFSSMMQVQAASRLVRSPVVWAALTDAMIAQGGREGLRQAVTLCRQGHEAGLLSRFRLPSAAELAAQRVASLLSSVSSALPAAAARGSSSSSPRGSGREPYPKSSVVSAAGGCPSAASGGRPLLSRAHSLPHSLAVVTTGAASPSAGADKQQQHNKHKRNSDCAAFVMPVLPTSPSMEDAAAQATAKRTSADGQGGRNAATPTVSTASTTTVVRLDDESSSGSPCRAVVTLLAWLSALQQMQVKQGWQLPAGSVDIVIKKAEGATALSDSYGGSSAVGNAAATAGRSLNSCSTDHHFEHAAALQTLQVVAAVLQGPGGVQRVLGLQPWQPEFFDPLLSPLARPVAFSIADGAPGAAIDVGGGGAGDTSGGVRSAQAERSDAAGKAPLVVRVSVPSLYAALTPAAAAPQQQPQQQFPNAD